MESRKTFYLITILVLLSWLALDLIPSKQCSNTYFLGFIHWDVCENMGTFTNALYVIFQILIVIASAYLIVSGLIHYKSER